MNGDERKYRLADLGRGVKNSFKAIWDGEFLLRLNPGRFFIHIVYTFLMFAVAIWISLAIDNTLTKVEAGKDRLKEAKILYTDRMFKLAEAQRRANVAARLESMGSDIQEPVKPAKKTGR